MALFGLCCLKIFYLISILKVEATATAEALVISTGCYAVLIGGQLPTLRNSISVPFSRINFPFFLFESLSREDGTGRQS